MALRIQHPALSMLNKIEHGFFTRKGGTSSDTYRSLNCGYGSDDSREQVSQNRALVANTMNVSAEMLVTAYQVHSPDALIIDAPFTGNAPKVDALVTNKPGLAIAILTADCGPLLFADEEAGVVAAAHAGWRGAVDGIIENTISRMIELGAKPDNITALLGPTISKPNYEVDDSFCHRFAQKHTDSARFFAEGTRVGHKQFDLPAFIMARLEACQIGSAINLDLCTYGKEDSFFSYRRATHRKEPDYGRQISAIALRS